MQHNYALCFGAGGHNIDSGGIDAAVPQNIRQLCNILLNAVESTGKELPQIVGKDFGRIYIRYMAQPVSSVPIYCCDPGGCRSW